MSQKRSNKRSAETKPDNLEVTPYRCTNSKCTETFQSWENFRTHCATDHNIMLPDNIRKRSKPEPSTRPRSQKRTEVAEQIRTPQELPTSQETSEENEGEEQRAYQVVLKARNGEYSCSICSTIFKHRHRFLNHLQAHESNTLPFPCEICGFSFADPIKVMEHVAVRHPEQCPSLPFVCERCNKGYKLNNHFQKHINKCQM